MENEEIIKPILPDPEEKEVWAESIYPAYEVSTFGQVRNKRTKRHLTAKLHNTGGYPQVHLRIGIDNKNGKFIEVHRLVGLAFVKNDNPDEYVEIDHIDRNRLNPYYKNLRWVNHVGNSQNKYGRSKYLSRKKTPLVLVDKETLELIKEFKNIYDASEQTEYSISTITGSIHNYRPHPKIGRFMTREDFLNEKNLTN